jgi:hypothetical protein
VVFFSIIFSFSTVIQNDIRGRSGGVKREGFGYGDESDDNQD